MKLVMCGNKIIGLLLLSAVMVVFLSPAWQVEPTAMRAVRQAAATMAMLALAPSLEAPNAGLRVTPAFMILDGLTPEIDIIALDCARLC